MSLIQLPVPSVNGTKSLEELLNSRRSRRAFADEPCTIEHVSQVLWAAMGITRKSDKKPEQIRGGLKTAPSAGATYALFAYVVVGNVTGLQPGIYRYIEKDHALEQLQNGDLRTQLCQACNGQAFVEQAPFTVVYGANYQRCTNRYAERGTMRYVCMDAGHTGQNVYLQCESLGLSTCAVGAFSDKALANVMQLPEGEIPLYVFPVGVHKDYNLPL